MKTIIAKCSIQLETPAGIAPILPKKQTTLSLFGHTPSAIIAEEA